VAPAILLCSSLLSAFSYGPGTGARRRAEKRAYIYIGNLGAMSELVFFGSGGRTAGFAPFSGARAAKPPEIRGRDMWHSRPRLCPVTGRSRGRLRHAEQRGGLPTGGQGSEERQKAKGKRCTSSAILRHSGCCSPVRHIHPSLPEEHQGLSFSRPPSSAGGEGCPWPAGRPPPQVRLWRMPSHRGLGFVARLRRAK